MNPNFKTTNPLLPAIIQDARTKQVLMQGWINEEAYQKTRETKRVWFWSRSKDRLWQKGEESGHYLEVVDLKADCDSDALLIRAIPHGPTCHKGEYSCFGVDAEDAIDFLEYLYSLVESRKRELPNDSYTASLFKQGLAVITAKITEEAGEVVKAAKSETLTRLAEEISDLLFHLIVLMNEKGVTLEQISRVLQKRNARKQKQ